MQEHPESRRDGTEARADPDGMEGPVEKRPLVSNEEKSPASDGGAP
jgi:hypothetical protein